QKPGASKILWPGARNDAEFSGFVRSAKVLPLGRPEQEALSASVSRRAALRGRNVVSFPARPANSIVAFRLRDPDGAVHLQFLRSGDDSAQFSAVQTGDYQGVARWLAPDSGRTVGSERFTYTLDSAGSEDVRQLAAFEKSVAALKPKLGRHAELA